MTRESPVPLHPVSYDADGNPVSGFVNVKDVEDAIRAVRAEALSEAAALVKTWDHICGPELARRILALVIGETP